MPKGPADGRRGLKVKLVAWGLVVAVLAIVGMNVEGHLRDATLVVPGTEYARVLAKYEKEFGERIPMGIMLRGPARELDRQGPAVVRALRRETGASTISPWDRGPGSAVLRPRRNSVLIVAEFEAHDGDFSWMVPKARKVVGRTTTAPVSPHYTGFLVFAQGLKDESIKASHRAEMIAFPVLIIVLLLVFRSPVAAAIPLVIGGATVAAGRGVLELVADATPLDAAAVSVESMMGLALGVDYALLVVSRFREELRRGSSGMDAASVAAATAGRTVAFAGVALMVAMGIVLMVAPGAVLVSMFIGVFVAAVLGVLIAVYAIPSLLAVLGTHIERWRLPQRRAQTPWVAIAGRAMRRPAIAVPLIVASLLAMAAPVSALETGPPDVRQLPANSEIRRDFELVNRVMGPGWGATYEIIVAREKGPITDAKTLAAIGRWQRRVSRIDGVATVVGPGPLARTAKGIPERLAQTRHALNRGGPALRDLNSGLERAAGGLNQLNGGLEQAANGAGRIENGVAAGAEGTGRLYAALQAAADGSQRLASGLATARAAARRLAGGSGQATTGGRRLASGLARIRRAVEAEAVPGARTLADGLAGGARDLERLREPAQSAQADLEKAYRLLNQMSIGKADPRYAQLAVAVGRASAAVSGRDPRTGQPVSPDYDGMDASLRSGANGLRDASAGASRLADGSARLAATLSQAERGARKLAGGMGRLERGNARIASGLTLLANGGTQLHGGLQRIAPPVDRLRRGLERLQTGAGKLREGLRSGRRQLAPLQGGVSRAPKPLKGFQTQIVASRNQLDQLKRRSPRLFNSGDFVLAALDGAPPGTRNAVTTAINLDRGGQAARVLVVPKTGPNDAGTAELGKRLSSAAHDLEKETGADVGVGGGAAELAAYDQATSARFTVLVLALALVTWVALLVIFRAVLLSLVAVVLNLLTVGASFGLLTLLFQGPGLPLGGPGFLDAIMITGIFTVTFGLSIDYEVFLITRMREGHLAGLGNREAIRFGIDKTAHVVTGAAMIMTGVFAAFVIAGTGQLRQLGAGLVIAVILDATIVRLLLLPAALMMLGRWAWWLPGWLDRRLPHLDIERETARETAGTV